MPFLFALTMFVSATLLFLVQPMVGKMVLPLLGGTPAVWNTCMVFYQALLLFGYFYAHKSTIKMSPGKQTAVHAMLLLTALGCLVGAALLTANHSPIAVVESLSPQGDDYPFFGVIVILAVAIGLPFFVVSTSAPLLQKWFAETGHPSAKDPYFLYAASNFGSLLALVAYPAVVEPNLTLVHQAWVWAVGFVVLTALVIACGRAMHVALAHAGAEPAKRQKASNGAAGAVAEPVPSFLRKLRWVALAFVPSSLMLGVTTFITTDMLSIPLLWIVPLTLYLLTFIIVFSNVTQWVHIVMTLLMPVAVLLTAFVMTSRVEIKAMGAVAVHIGTFFIVAMVCHGELANDRPSPRHLTNFYLLMSVGGVLGGLFNALVAPIVFKFTSEYPITLVIACCLLPSLFDEKQRKFGKWTRPFDFLVPCGIFFLCRVLQQNQGELSHYLYDNAVLVVGSAVAFCIPAAICIVFLETSIYQRLALGIFLGLALVVYGLVGPLADYLLLRGTSFERFNLGFASIPSSTALRWLAVGLLSAAYAFWAIFSDRANASWKLGTGLGALAVCLISMLSVDATKVFDAGAFWAKKFEANITVRTLHKVLVYGLPAMICYFFVERPLRFGAAVAALWLATYYTEMKASDDEIVRVRSFFGRIKIETDSRWKFVPSDLFPDEIENDAQNYAVQSETVRDVKTIMLYPIHQDRRPPVPAYKIKIETKDGKQVKTHFIRREFTTLVHGTTTHGLQERDRLRTDILRALLPLGAPNFAGAMFDVVNGSGTAMMFPGRDPTTYYHRSGPVGSMFAAWGRRNRGRTHPNTDVACIGLGTGSLSAYGLPGQKMTFFEIDTHVRRLVEPPTYFTYIDEAKRQGVDIQFEMGDARISLERMRRKFGFMLVDAFSSDAIPAHLLTLQAVRMYFDHLEEDGLLAVHISNRYLDLEPVVERICRELHLECRIMHGRGDPVDAKRDYIDNDSDWYSNFANPSSWIVIAKSESALGPIQQQYEQYEADKQQAATNNEKEPDYHDHWLMLDRDDKVGLWTDDFSPIIPILKGEWRFWAPSSYSHE